jgi:hypothetical protein
LEEGLPPLLQTSTPLKTHIRDARKDDTFSADPFLASLRDAIFLTNATRGFEDSTPGYGL